MNCLRVYRASTFPALQAGRGFKAVCGRLIGTGGALLEGSGARGAPYPRNTLKDPGVAVINSEEFENWIHSSDRVLANSEFRSSLIVL